MRSGNPVLKESVFKGVSFQGGGASASAVIEAPMTIQGVMAKTALLLLAVTAAASFTFQKAIASGAFPAVWVIGGAIGALILTFVISFKPKLAPMLAMPHALLEGLFLGGISAMYELSSRGPDGGPVPGLAGSIVLQAVILTFAVAFAMLGLYAFRVIRVTDKLRSIVIAATGGIALFYVIAMVLRMFGVEVPLIHSSGTMGIAFSVFVVGLAAFNLLLDFDIIESGAKSGAPKWMEWFGGFALIVTLVWLYIEILRLLSKLQSRD